jgi:hypothetical protein
MVMVVVVVVAAVVVVVVVAVVVVATVIIPFLIYMRTQPNGRFRVSMNTEQNGNINDQ